MFVSRFIAGALFVFGLAALLGGTAQALPGDVNESGIVEAGDGLGLIEHLIELTPLDGNGLTNADANLDGGVDVADFVQVARRAGAKPPAAPTVEPPLSPTKLTQVTLTGTAEPNTQVSVTGGASNAGSTAAGNGSFSVPVSLALNRVNRLYIRSTNAEDLESPTSAVAVIQDAQAPALFVDTPVDGSTVYRNTDWATGFGGEFTT